MNENIKISIVIPLFNKEDSIQATLNSVLSQTYNNFEVLIVDDGSTDGSVQVVNTNKDERIKLLSKVNGGVSEARNFGIERSNGEFIFLLDADDLIKKDCLTILYNLTSKYPQESIFTADFEIVNGSSLISASYCKGTESGIVSNAYKSLWEGLFFIRTGNTLIKKNCFDKVGMFDKNISYYEDMDHILRLIRDYDVVYTPKNIFTYKMEYNFLSSNPVKMSKDWTNYVSFKQKRFYEKLIIGNIIFNNIRKRFKQKDTTGALFLFRKHFWSTHYLLLAKILKKLNSNAL
jgi:glycosyltransferase involved in cell wall biosynthesis